MAIRNNEVTQCSTGKPKRLVNNKKGPPYWATLHW
jgi:hypothetical protein